MSIALLGTDKFDEWISSITQMYFESICLIPKTVDVLSLFGRKLSTHWTKLYKTWTNGLAIVVVVVWLLDLQLPIQSVPITTNIVSSNHAHVGCTR